LSYPQLTTGGTIQVQYRWFSALPCVRERHTRDSSPSPVTNVGHRDVLHSPVQQMSIFHCEDFSSTHLAPIQRSSAITLHNTHH
jgi:hypothetical protein